MYVLIYLSLFWAAILTAYVAAGRHEAPLTMAMLSLLCWLGVTFSSGSVEVVSEGSTMTFGSNGMVVIGAAGTLVMFVYVFVIVTDRFPTSVEDYDQEDKSARRGL